MSTAPPAGSSWLATVFSSAFGLSCLLGGSLLFALWWFQDNLLYFPNMPQGSRARFEKPQDYGLMPEEEVFFQTEDNVRIQAWLFRVPNSRKAPTFLYFCGNAGNISHRSPHILGFVRLGVNVLIVSYRGYGRSSNMSPTEPGLCLDAEAALKFARQHPELDPSKIVLFGESLGGAVSTYLAARHPEQVRALVLENTFTSIPEMIPAVLPLLKPFTFLSINKWNSGQAIGNVVCPILFLSGQKDELVPPRMMRELHERATKSPLKSFVPLPAGRHTDTWLAKAYYEATEKFLRQVFEQQGEGASIAKASGVPLL